MVAATSVIAKPISNDDIKLNGFACSVRTEVNCATGMYIKPSTTNPRMSDMILILPLNQLLKRIPPSIVPIPIQSKVMLPRTKLPIICLLVNILVNPKFSSTRSTGNFEIPLYMATNIIIIPAKVENILINVEGVGRFRELKALSTSNALITKASPKN